MHSCPHMLSRPSEPGCTFAVGRLLLSMGSASPLSFSCVMQLYFAILGSDAASGISDLCVWQDNIVLLVLHGLVTSRRPQEQCALALYNCGHV